MANMEDMLDLYANLASRLGLSEEGLGSILSGYYEMSAEGVTNLGLLINALESVPAEARGSPSEEGLYELADEDDPGSDEQGVGDGVVEAGPARIVEERGGEEVAEDEGESGLGEFGGVAGQREQTSLPDPELVEIMKQDMGVVTEAGARTLERLAIESKPSTNAAGGGQAVAEARGGCPGGVRGDPGLGSGHRSGWKTGRPSLRDRPLLPARHGLDGTAGPEAERPRNGYDDPVPDRDDPDGNGDGIGLGDPD